MPSATFYQPIEAILNGKCEYEYYSQNTQSYSKTSPSRICHVMLDNEKNYNNDIILMIFTIRNQPSSSQNYVWKIHSEGPRRQDQGATVPLRNKAEQIAKQNNWKYMSIAVAAEDVPENDIVFNYIVSMESYLYGEETVYPLTEHFNKLEELGRPPFYRCEASINTNKYSFAFIRKDCFLDYLRMFDNRAYSQTKENIKYRETTTRNQTDVNNIQSGENILLYGVPGCGKSHAIKTQYCSDETFIERVVFHPDYTYSDFVGQILPQNIDGNISYPFVPGPFTKILKKAYDNPEANYYLIIEEINRGNAPAIFGDIFQLLDRENGESIYFVNNSDVAFEVFKDKDVPIKIPQNLFILATMNTADQNVFTLDTAFKRRWKMVSIPNDFENCNLKDIQIGDTEITWKLFAETINDMIVDASLSSVSSEDKRLGAYFVTEAQLKDKRQFAEKVLAYLWDDVFKYDKTNLFDAGIRTLEELIDEFVKNGIEAFNSTVKETFTTKQNDI